MPRYSLAVALFDFVPVALTALALAWLARGIAARHPPLGGVAWAAAVVVPLGGACKASWKLTLALGGPALGWLENLLFIALAPGFVALAFSLHHARRAWQGGGAAAFSPARLALWLALPLGGALALAVALPATRAWFFWLLAVTAIANLVLLVQALAAASRARLHPAATISLCLSLAATMAMTALARLPPGEASAWLQEGVNAAGQAALAFGFWQLGRRMQEAP